jgi:hypothetical protein
MLRSPTISGIDSAHFYKKMEGPFCRSGVNLAEKWEGRNKPDLSGTPQHLAQLDGRCVPTRREQVGHKPHFFCMNFPIGKTGDH